MKQRYADRTAARSHIQIAVARGSIVPPNACGNCGKTETLHAHHYLGYKREHWADVQWLCASCHGEANSRQEISADSPSTEVHRTMNRIALTEIEYRKLRMISIDRNTTLTDLISDILRRWLNKQPAPFPKS